MTALDVRELRTLNSSDEWTTACAYDYLLPNRGVAVLLPTGEQAALFRLDDGSLRSVGNIDPFAGAAVMSRGLVGDRKGEPTVASPLLKQVFSLDSGICLDDPARVLGVFEVRVRDGLVEIRPAQVPRQPKQ
ncbi:nitrite reductase small subunit NirD [Hoyosella sp. YIM 151337]|uniref:nitrite reductase small subunit NirD n=1 Tax=Hoyosella sp. YIM 151337 TaxID=2992742 RepID=UPI002235C106|nr:nitrite reductase small subunit NirD [Hoyosella sp. YIM 151337]MCW4352269.1 nitrite reductase small subunit NirD [Hoyosella sp. YIM 151337]